MRGTQLVDRVADLEFKHFRALVFAACIPANRHVTQSCTPSRIAGMGLRYNQFNLGERSTMSGWARVSNFNGRISRIGAQVGK